MKSLFLFTVVFFLIIALQPMNISADETGVTTAGEISKTHISPSAEDESRVSTGYDTGYIEDVLASEDEVEILKCILVFIRDIDIILRYALIVSVGCVVLHFCVVRPLMQFLK